MVFAGGREIWPLRCRMDGFYSSTWDQVGRFGTFESVTYHRYGGDGRRAESGGGGDKGLICYEPRRCDHSPDDKRKPSVLGCDLEPVGERRQRAEYPK